LHQLQECNLLLLFKAMLECLLLQTFNFKIYMYMVVVTLVTVCRGNISQEGNEYVIVICNYYPNF